MNDKILCIYYSRTGNTQKAMTEIAEALDCECIAIRDKADRGGTFGYLRCGLDAMRKKTRAITRIHSAHELSEYDLVILGTPIWAGRCSSIIRGFLKRHGYEFANVAYVVTHKSKELYRDVYRQMDQYVEKPHVAAVSLRPGDTGCEFWQKQFIRSCTDFMAGRDA